MKVQVLVTFDVDVSYRRGTSPQHVAAQAAAQAVASLRLVESGAYCETIVDFVCEVADGCDCAVALAEPES